MPRLRRSGKMSSVVYFKLCFVLGLCVIDGCNGLTNGTSAEDEKPPSKDETSTLSVSFKKCHEYSKLTRPHLKFSSDLHGEVDQCKITEKSAQSGDAQYGEVPHMALIGHMRDEEMEYICGGSLISETYVLTTGYCASEVAKTGDYFVRLGGIHLNNRTNNADTQLIRVSETILHPKYVREEVYNDISLLRLGAPAVLSSYVRPICLCTGVPDTTKMPLIASGWGLDPITLIRNEVLRKVKLVETPYEVCKVPYDLKKVYGKVLKNGIDNATMICATHPLGNDSLCQLDQRPISFTSTGELFTATFESPANVTLHSANGDGGGPLYIRSQEAYCSYQLVGIIGFGGVCKKIQDVPSVFTRVAPYVLWIENIVW